MEKFRFGDREIEYRIKRGKRKKSVAISISDAAQVVVLVPQSLNKEKIQEIVQKKARWILEKQTYFKRLKDLFPEKELISGEQFLFAGRKYRLKVREVEEECAIEPLMQGRRLIIFVNKGLSKEIRKEIIKEKLVKWYFSSASELVAQRLRRYRNMLNIEPAGIIIRNQQKRWGSCSNSGVLRFNWRIAMAPISIIDYVIVHELCHLKEKNHSREFWRQVSLAVPDYQKRRKWLRENSASLNF
jgi:hypothetical protein